MANTPEQSTARAKEQPLVVSAPPTKDRSSLVALVVAVVALVGQIVTGVLQYQANQRGNDLRLVDLGISVLRAPPSDDIANIREWALDVVEDGSGRKFSAAQRNALLKKPFPSIDWRSAAAGTILNFAPRPCSSFRRNPDGSWTQTEKITMPGNNTVEGNTFKGGNEARILDQLCGIGNQAPQP